MKSRDLMKFQLFFFFFFQDSKAFTMSQVSSPFTIWLTWSISSSASLPDLPKKAKGSPRGTKRKVILFYSSLSKRFLDTPFASPGPGVLYTDTGTVGLCFPGVLASGSCLPQVLFSSMHLPGLLWHAWPPLQLSYVGTYIGQGGRNPAHALIYAPAQRNTFF